jgi:amino acid adenylation domain-containing protein
MAERLSMLNGNPKILDGPSLLHELVQWECGAAPALEFMGPDGQRWKYTYDELRKCVSYLAARLNEILSASSSYLDDPQPTIPLLVPQSPALYISQLATLEVGAAFCPINLDAPKDRIKFIVGDVVARIIISTRENESNVTWENGPTVIFVDDFFNLLKDEVTPISRLRAVKAEELAYVMYTSGSTGLPKGVGVSHLAVTQSLLAHDKFIPPFKRFLQFAAPSFDVSVFEIFFPLFRGCTLVGCSRVNLLNDLTGMINILEVDACELTPTVAGSLVQKRKNVPRLELLLTIGEMLTRPVVDEFGASETAKGILYGMYGPTEAAIHCTINPLMQAGSKVGNIGVPLDTCSCFIASYSETPGELNEIKLLPLGEVGELVLGGPQLAEGYINREKENKAAFVTLNGERAYRTGDKGRMLEDGTIEIMGRISAGQVKLRGQRVELGEIEEVVYKNPGIKLAFASVLNGQLVVFASTQKNSVTFQDVMETCEKWLPKYMVPSELVLMDEFPYLPSGKINKKQLHSDHESKRAEENQDDLETETERTVSSIIQELLGLKVSATKRLASYGLDSLMAIRFASRLRAIGWKVSTVEILQAETLGAIARRCDEYQRTSTESKSDILQSFDFTDLTATVTEVLSASQILDSVEEVLPCTPLQDAMLLETAVDAAAYSNRVRLRIEQDLTPDDIRASILKLAQQNSILRTGFVNCQSSFSAFTQVIWRELSESQVDVVETFDRDSDEIILFSVLRPLRVQIRQSIGFFEVDIHIHHALYDAWSLELLVDDLEAIVTNKALVSRPPFREFVEGELRARSAEQWPTEQYWRDHLAQLDPVGLPNFHSKTNISRGLEVAGLQTSISTNDLENIARNLQISSQSLVQAAYALILSSYLGKGDICFGTVFSGRTSSLDGIEDINGPTLSTLPVRIDISGEASVEDIAQSLNTTIRKHLEHDSLPLREIKKLVEVNHGSPLFDTLVIWQQTLHSVDHRRETVKLIDSTDYLEFNLTLEITPEKEAIHLRANYQRALFPQAQIDLLLRQIEQVVVQFIKLSLDQGCTALDDSLLSVENSEPCVPYGYLLGDDDDDKDAPTQLIQSDLAAYVELIASMDPSRPAIDFAYSVENERADVKRTPYGELNAKANQLAHVLHSKNVVPDELVCICMDKSTELYVSILATIKSGAGYLPITSETPLDRVQYIVQEAKVRIVLASRATAELFHEISLLDIIVVEDLDYIALPIANLPVTAGPDNLAYCVFTSGSTGVPKGVLVTRSNVISNLEVLKEVYPHSKDSRLLQSCSQGFDVSVFEIFFTWQIGGCLCAATKDTIFRDIEMAIRALDVTHLSMTTTVASLITPKNVPKVEILISAGEAMTPTVHQVWAGHGLYNAYGPSESTNVVTVKEDIQLDDVLATIGSPLRNVSAFILAPGQDFKIVPRGGEGELCHGGPQITKGYLDTAQNAGKFIEHPKYGRIYRTGDFGRLLPNGLIIYLGRQDDQIKVRGQRVELGEISRVLLSSSAVYDCTTLTVDGGNGEQRIVSFWVAARSSEAGGVFSILTPDATFIRKLYSLLTAALPVYMIPSAIIPVSILPPNLVGKVDKALLKKHYQSLTLEYLEQVSDSQAAESDYSYSELEQKIIKAVAQIAKVSETAVGPNTSFFALGIDSISAISLARILKDDFGSRVEISEILKHPSVSRLAEQISARENAATTSVDPPTPEEIVFDADFLAGTIDSIAKQGRRVERILPCTPLQEAMLSATEVATEAVYRNQVVLNLKVSIDRFEEAWRYMVKRHEILRTCFGRATHSQFAFCQIVLAEFEHHSKILEYSEVKLAETLRSINTEQAEQLEHEPPYGLIYIKSDTSVKLVLTMHHALYDGYAMSILYQEIEDFFHKKRFGAPVSFGPFLHYMTSVDGNKSDAYWGTLLHDFYPVPFNSSSDKGKEGKSSVTIQSRSESKLSWIEESVKIHSSSLLATCQVAWATLLAEQSQGVDICFGNVVSGRTLPVDGLNRLVAPCFNTIPIRVRDLHRQSYVEAFRLLQAQNADSLPFQMTALRRIQSKFGQEGIPLFDSLLLLQPPVTELDESIWTIEEDVGAMDLPVVIEIIPCRADDTLELVLHYHGSLLSRDKAACVIKRFDAILKTSLESPRHQILSAPKKAHWALNTEHRRSKQVGGKNTSTDGGKALPGLESTIRDVISNFTTIPKDSITRGLSIYRLGLDSINAVQVAMALRKEGYKLVASDVLQYPTIEQLAEHIASQSEDQTASVKRFDFVAFDMQYRNSVLQKVQAAEADIEAIRPCTPVQCGMLAQSLHSSGKEYINTFSMELTNGVDLDKLRSAWETVLQQCEILRTGFVGLETVRYPFAMVTYRARFCQLPWFDYRELLDMRMTIEDLGKCPWRLEVVREDAKTVVKFTGHHAIYDAHTLELILSSVAQTYQSLGSLTLKPFEPILEAILNSNEIDEERRKAYWQNENKIFINRFPELTPLRESSTRSITRSIPSSFSLSKIEEICRQQEISVQAAGQAAWARLLSAYAGECSVTFGVTLSGRSIVGDAEKVPFPTIVTLPVSCDVVGTNSELLDRTMRNNAKLHKYQFTPLTSIQRWTGHPEGNLFDTLFAYQKTGSNDNATESLWNIVDEEASADYAVSIELLPTDNGVLMLQLTVKENIVPAEHAELMLRQFDALLADTILNTSCSCENIIVDDSKLLSVTPPEHPELPAPVALLHEFVSAQAAKTPHKIALEFTTSLEPMMRESWTYAQLEAEANKIAHLLQERGAVQDQLIAISFDKCPEASFSILAVLKAGCAYVALDPNAPPDRAKFIMEDSKSKIILSAGKTFENLSQTFGGQYSEIEVIDVGKHDVWASLSSKSPELSRPVDPQDTSYCLYTSGTTGTPKGCEITHENAVQAMLAFQHLFAGHWTPESKWLQFASFHFDVSVLEQFWSWGVGICVASAPRDLIFEDIPEAIRQLGITHLDLTPSLARLLHPNDVPSLTKGVFITGGEQLKQEILDVWGEHACVYNGYGPTEATIGVTMYPRVPKNGKPANIGPQFLNVGSFVLKPGTSVPVLRGAVGELCVSGKLVGKGYLNRPDLTKERFPYLEALGERVYRTGDLVRILHDGSFIFLGRADDQVKLRGQRLELTEITEVIKKNVEGLHEVVTLVLKHSKQQKEQLVVFFVPTRPGSSRASTSSKNAKVESSEDAKENQVFIQEMRHACTAHLPGYMVPTHFVPLESLPLSANNKADAKQLAKQYDDLSIEDLQALGSAGQASKEWTSLQLRVLEIIASAINIQASEIKSGTNIFELGFDSISVIGLSRMLLAAGYENAKLATVMKNSSIESLLKVLLNNENSSADDYSAHIAASQKIAAFKLQHIVSVAEELDVDPLAIEALAPCTAAQAGMIYRFLDSDDALYFSSFDFKLDLNVDLVRLEQAWIRAIAGLEVLRMKFVLTSGGCAQVVLKSIESPWAVVDVKGPPSDNFKEALETENSLFGLMDKVEALANPYKITVVQNEVRRVMNIDIFHGLYDGVSLPLVLRKVFEEYQGKEAVQYGPSFLSVLPYGPLANAEGAEAFWRETCRDLEYVPMLEIRQDAQPHDVTSSITITNLKHLEHLRQSLGVTYQAIIQAAWSTVLQDYLSISHLPAFGVVVSGRSIDYENADQVIGPLLNTLVFHVSGFQGMTWNDLIEACHAFNTAVIPYQHTPLKDVQKWCGKGVGRELFDTLFVFQRGEEEDKEVMELWNEIEGEPVADYPLAFEATLKGNGDVLVTVVGQGSVLDDAIAVDLLKKVEGVLAAMKMPDEAVPSLVNVSRVSEGPTIPKQQEIASSDRNMKSDMDFKWTKQARSIRSEIASLTKAPSGSITANASLFSLGLDSIDVIKLAARLKKSGISISVSSIIKSQTIAKMVQHLGASAVEVEKPKTSMKEYEERLRAVLAREGKDVENAVRVLPATPLQEGMVAEMISSDYARYFNHELYCVQEGVDMEKLKKAWESVVREADILRTTFLPIDDAEIDFGFAQVVNEPSANVWEIVEISPEEEIGAKTREIIQSAIEAASRGKLFQLRDIIHGQNRYNLLSISHALYDGWSLQALHADVQKAYNDESINRPDPTATLEQLFNVDGPEATKFWRNTLAGLSKTSFPLQATSSPYTVNRFERPCVIKLDYILRFCRRHNISLQTLGQTAWAFVLAMYLRRLDVAFGVVLSCRDTEEANEVMFPLMNTVAVRTIIHDAYEDVLHDMQERSNAMRPYQHFPLRKAQALVGNGEGSLFDTLFIYQGRTSSNKAAKQNLYKAVESKSEVEFAICVEMEIVDEQLVWRIACKDAARTEEQAEQLVRHLDHVVASIMGDSAMRTVMSVPGEGISICGLPAFELESVAVKKKRTKAIVRAEESEWSVTELAIRAVLSQVSKVPEAEISTDQTIFHLGLDSISTIKVSSLLRKEDIRLSVNDIMKNNTISEMSELLKARVKTPAPSVIDVDTTISTALKELNLATLLENANIKEANVEYILPVTAGQLYMISRWQETSGDLFFSKFRYELCESLDKENLEVAWAALLQRHAILRTVFVVLEEKKLPAVQIVLKETENRIKWASSVTDAEGSLYEPLSLTVEQHEGHQTICLSIHHALYDAISLPLILEDLQALYAGSNLPSSSPGFRDFVAQSLTTTSSPRQNQRQEFWKSYLQQQPTASTRITKHYTTNKKIELFVPAIPIANLTSYAQAFGVSPDALILAAFSKVFSSRIRSSTSAATFGLYLSNRSPFGLDLSHLAAPTLNLLPLHIADTSATLTTLAQGVQKDLAKLSSEVVCGSSLKEIWEYTGVGVNVFVNLLKGTVSFNAQCISKGARLFETPAGEDWSTPRAQVIAISNNESIHSTFGKMAESVRCAYLVSQHQPWSCGRKRNRNEMINTDLGIQPTIDIELRFTDTANGPALDVGVFAPEAMLSLKDAKMVVEELGSVLRGL